MIQCLHYIRIFGHMALELALALGVTTSSPLSDPTLSPPTGKRWHYEARRVGNSLAYVNKNYTRPDQQYRREAGNPEQMTKSGLGY